MTVSFHDARRRPGLVVLGIAGPSGGGKSFSALRLARGLAGKDPFYVIDTENGKSEQLYGDKFQPWICGVMSPPYTPEAYVDAIDAAIKHGAKCIVVDSVSDEWDGTGGICDEREAYLDKKAGNDFGRRDILSAPSWAHAKKPHQKLVRELRAPRCHLILCMRAQDKIALVKDEKGKTQFVPKPTLTGVNGWEPICEKRLPFECFASLLLLPDKPGVPRPIKLPEPWLPFIALDKPISEETGAALAKWATVSGSGPATDRSVDGLVAGLLDLADQLGKRAETADQIDEKRAGLSPAKFVEWLQRQISAATAAVAKIEKDAA